MWEKLFRGREKTTAERSGFQQAASVAGYCLFVGLILWNGGAIFGTAGNFLGPAMMLILFSVSVLICGLLVFYQPYRLFFDGKKKEAIDLVLYTTGWLGLFFFAFLTLFLLIR